MKNLLEDAADPKPLPGVTAYAGGAALQGLALGIFISHFFLENNAWLKWAIVGAAYLVGVVLTIGAFSRLKRKYRIVRIDES